MLACAADEVLVGMNGTTATYVQQVSPLCVRVNQNGQWLGTPVARGITGSAGATSYSKVCPVDSAISGFRGRAAQYVNQIDLECRALDVQRQTDRQWHVPRAGRSRHWHRRGPVSLRHQQPGLRALRPLG